MDDFVEYLNRVMKSEVKRWIGINQVDKEVVGAAYKWDFAPYGSKQKLYN